MKDKERVQKLISQAGVMSRRKAEEEILKGNVFINDKVAKLGDKATFKDNIMINGKYISKKDHIYLMLNKPKQTITALSDDRGRKTVRDLIDIEDYIFPIGRLDYNTTGILLLTNDGELANKLMHPSSSVIRTYKAKLDKELTDEDLKFLNSENVKLDGDKSLQQVGKLINKTYSISLKQGKYHHVKRVFELVGAFVKELHRVEFAGLSFTELPKGSFRILKPKEIKWLKQFI